MLSEDISWTGNSPADKKALLRLRGSIRAPLPEEYLAFLSFSDGGEGPLGIEPGYIVVNSALEAAENAEAGTFAEFFPGFFVFGGNGAGEAFAFDFRENCNCRVVRFDMTNIDLDESVVTLADSFASLIPHIGVG